MSLLEKEKLSTPISPKTHLFDVLFFLCVPESQPAANWVMYNITHNLGSYIYHRTFVTNVRVVSRMSYWIKYHNLNTSEEKSLAFVVMPHNPEYSCRWRLVYKIIKTHMNCHCSDEIELFLSRFPHGMSQQGRVDIDDILENIDDDEKAKLAHDLDKHNTSFILQEGIHKCLLCSQQGIIPWNHFHADIHLLEILHTEMVWICIGENTFYSGWIPVRKQGSRHVSVLFEVDYNQSAVRYIMGQFSMTDENEERFRITTVPLSLDPSYVTLFKMTKHRPCPHLVDIVLPYFLQCDVQYLQLPATLQERYSEVKKWINHFGRRKSVFICRAISFVTTAQ